MNGGGGPRLPAQLPREAREGIMRVWLEILRDKHPEVVWVPRTCSPIEASEEAGALSAGT